MINSYPDEKSWLDARQATIGASESAAALGLSPWESPYSLWCRKTTALPPKDLSEVEVVEWGTRLEKAIVDAFADRTGRRVRWNDSYTVAVSDQAPFLSATLDAVQFARPNEELTDEPGCLEIKTTSEWNANTWEDGRPPEYMRVQLQQQMLCAGLTWGSIAVLVAGQRMITHTERFKAEFWEAAIPQLQEFWRCVEQGEQPEIDNHKATAKAIALLYPMDNGKVAELPSDAATWCMELVHIKSQIKELRNQCRLYENKLKDALGEAEVGACAGFVVKYPTIDRAGYSVEPTSYRRLTVKSEG